MSDVPSDKTVRVLAKGLWCEGCQYFEAPDDIVGDRCMSCGCSASVHLEAQVVALPEDDDAPIPVYDVFTPVEVVDASEPVVKPYRGARF